MVHIQGALKQSLLEPDDMFYQKQKLTGLSQKSISLLCYMFYFMLFIKNVLQNSWKTTATINSAP